MLAYTLFGLFILACFVLIVVILLQPGKADAGALFSSSLSSTAFGPRGTASLLAKITIGAAAAFMLIALTLSLPGITGTRSVLQSTDEDDAAPAPTQQASPAATQLPSPEVPVAPASSSPAGSAASPAATPQ